MNKAFSNRVGAVMLTNTIQALTTSEKMAFIRSCEQAGSFTALQGSPKELLLKAEQSNVT